MVGDQDNPQRALNTQKLPILGHRERTAIPPNWTTFDQLRANKVQVVGRLLRGLVKETECTKPQSLDLMTHDSGPNGPNLHRTLCLV